MNKFYSYVCFMFWVHVEFQWENWAINLCSSLVGFGSEIRIVPPCSPTPMSLQKWSRDYSDLIFARLFSTLRTGHLDCEPLNPRFYKIYFFTRNNMLPTHFWENSLPSPGLVKFITTKTLWWCECNRCGMSLHGLHNLVFFASQKQPQN